MSDEGHARPEPRRRPRPDGDSWQRIDLEQAEGRADRAFAFRRMTERQREIAEILIAGQIVGLTVGEIVEHVERRGICSRATYYRELPTIVALLNS